MYFPCLTASLSLSFGLRNFVTSIVSIVFKIDFNRMICSSFLDNSSMPRLAFSTLLIVMILIDSIPINDEISPNKPGRLYWSSYSRYHSVFSIYTLLNRYMHFYVTQRITYLKSINIINYFAIVIKIHD